MPESRPLRGADLLVHTLREFGVERIYTLSGNHIMSIFDACIGSAITLIHSRHEAACVHMADAQGRLTGVPAVAMVTGGPGHANAIGALYTALMAESPMVLISGQSPLNQAGKGAFQEIDQVAMAAPVCKAAWSIRQPECLQSDLRLAFKIAASGRPGPVSLSVPSDLLENLAGAQVPGISSLAASPVFGRLAEPVFGRQAESAVASTSAPVWASALAWLASGRRPLILAGPTMLSALRRPQITSLETRLGIPVVAMDSPRGIDDPRLGRFAAKLAIADRVLLVAKRVDFTVRFASTPAFAADCEFMQFEPDQAELERARNTLGARLVKQECRDPEDCFAGLAAPLAPDTPAASKLDWLGAVREACRARPASWAALPRSPTASMHPAQIGRVLNDLFLTHPDAVLVVDGGEFSQWVQACVDPARRIINGPAGAIGTALPMALAARAVEPHAPVVALMGDGGYGFHPMEFDTAVRAGLPFVVIIGNDRRWNAEYQIQLRQYGEDRLLGCELTDPAYEQIALAMGGTGERIESEDQLRTQLQRAISSTQPCCLNVQVSSLAAPTMKD